jgi:hypothetical protein
MGKIIKMPKKKPDDVKTIRDKMDKSKTISISDLYQLADAVVKEKTKWF